MLRPPSAPIASARALTASARSSLAPRNSFTPLAAPVALLGMTPVRQDRGDQGLGRGTELPCPAEEVLGAPLGMAVARRHVIAQRGRARRSARMGRDPATSPEHLDRARTQPHLDLLTDQRVRHRVGGTRDFDVIVQPDPHPQPFGILVRRLGERVQNRPVELIEQLDGSRPAAAAAALSRSRAVAISRLHSSSEKKVCRRSRPSSHS